MTASFSANHASAIVGSHPFAPLLVDDAGGLISDNATFESLPDHEQACDLPNNEGLSHGDRPVATSRSSGKTICGADPIARAEQLLLIPTLLQTTPEAVDCSPRCSRDRAITALRHNTGYPCG